MTGRRRRRRPDVGLIRVGGPTAFEWVVAWGLIVLVLLLGAMIVAGIVSAVR